MISQFVKVDLTDTNWEELQSQVQSLNNQLESLSRSGHESSRSYKDLSQLLRWINNIRSQASEQIGRKKIYGR